MRSGSTAEVARGDDRTTRARIRDAAIEVFADLGVAGTTARRVAAAAGVSPGLVIHHFGSMDGLRSECDEYVVAAIRTAKSEAIGAGFDLDLTAALRASDLAHLSGYLAKVLVDDSAAVARLVDDLVTDAVEYLQIGVEAGLVRPAHDMRARATVLMLWSLGALVLHEHMKRLLGVDPIRVSGDPAVELAAYAGPAYEILGTGILTEEFASHIQRTIAGVAGPTEGHA